jgi:pyrroloquinoline quinone biosynthesis protein A
VVQVLNRVCRQVPPGSIVNPPEDSTMWTKPSYTALRIGFEVTMYFANR